MKLKIDLHVHTSYSDGKGNAEEVIEVARAKGLDGIAITDHNTLQGYFESKTCGDLVVLPDYEVETDAAHVLVVGLEELPHKVDRMRYEELVAWARGRNGLVILAHPAVSRSRLDRWSRCSPDAVEVLNASYPLMAFFVDRGLSIAKKLRVSGVGGSDAHRPQDVGYAYTLLEADGRGFEHVIESIRSGRASFEGNLSPFANRLRAGIGYAYSFLRLGGGQETQDP